MTRILAFVILVLLSSVGYTDEIYQTPDASQSQNSEQIAQRGCCSHHGGVCGCQGGRAVCCDGQYSPSCGCHADDIKEFLKSSEAEQPKS